MTADWARASANMVLNKIAQNILISPLGGLNVIPAPQHNKNSWLPWYRSGVLRGKLTKDIQQLPRRAMYGLFFEILLTKFLMLTTQMCSHFILQSPTPHTHIKNNRLHLLMLLMLHMLIGGFLSKYVDAIRNIRYHIQIFKCNNA